MSFSRSILAANLLLLVSLAGCSSVNSDRWQRGKHYVWLPPKTGTNVGRWVEKDDGSQPVKTDRAKKKAKATKEKKAKAKAKAPAAQADGTPPERFR